MDGGTGPPTVLSLALPPVELSRSRNLSSAIRTTLSDAFQRVSAFWEAHHQKSQEETMELKRAIQTCRIVVVLIAALLVFAPTQAAPQSRSGYSREHATVVAPTITTQPASKSVTAGQSATFSVKASGTAPLSYEWLKNGATIRGATSSVYTTPAETTLSNGAQFTVVISNSAGTVTSNAATLTVNAAAAGALTPSTTSLSFGNVNVGSNSALNVNFTNSGSSNITVSSVTISGAGFTASGVSNGQIVTPGQVVTLNVTFAPAGSGSITGSVTVTSNASNSRTTISLSGTGVQSTVTSITVTPANPTLAIGSELQFRAVDSLGNDVTSSVVWASSDGSIATITANGLATGMANGSVTITASN